MKKIKLFVGMFSIACILGMSLTIGYAKADTAYDEMDKLFQSTLSEILDYESTEDSQISAEKELLYDIELNPLGLLYRFDYQNKEGFAIIINNGVPTVTELATDSPAPYDLNENTMIYISLGMYWYYDGLDYYDCLSDLQIPDEAVEAVAETAFRGAVELFYASEKVYYIYRSETKYNILSSIPDYTYGLTNGCAGVGGSNIITYYDKTYSNLIPNYEPGTLFLGIYRFKGENATTMALAETLHSDMKTNTTVAGTTIPQFKTGLTAYVNRQGYSISYTSIMSSNKINFESAKSVVQNGKAIALFLDGFRTVLVDKYDGYDNIAFEYSNATHVMAGFGCLEVNYTLTNNQARTDKYIHVASGIGLFTSGYINIAVTQIDDAYAINIA